MRALMGWLLGAVGDAEEAEEIAQAFVEWLKRTLSLTFPAREV